MQAWHYDWDYDDCRWLPARSEPSEPSEPSIAASTAASRAAAQRARRLPERPAASPRRDIVVSWYDSISQYGLALLRKTNSYRYEAQAQYLEETFMNAVLVDPNTGVELFESPEILEYLEEVYTV